MYSLFRPILRSIVVRNTSLAIRPTARLGVTATLLHARTVASSVSMRPGSQTLEHAATNVKEELGNSAADLAKVISGANVTTDSVSDTESFVKITSKVAHQVPEPILVLGLIGGLPYIAASATTVYFAHQAQLAASGVMIGMDPRVALTLLDQALNLQVTYGAVMLSFLGALHWGMEMASYGGHKGYARLALGAAPMLIAWPTLGMQPMMALLLQWTGFTGLWLADSKATTAGWTPKWYSQYRFYLSILVGSWWVYFSLIWYRRAHGFVYSFIFSILGSVAGTTYWGPVAGHGFLSRDLDLIREERKKNMPLVHGMIQGPIEAVPAGTDADHYTKIHNRDTEKKEN